MKKIEVLKLLDSNADEGYFKDFGFSNLNDEWNDEDTHDMTCLSEVISEIISDDIPISSDDYLEDRQLEEIVNRFVAEIKQSVKSREQIDIKGLWDNYSCEYDQRLDEYNAVKQQEYNEYVHMVAVESRNW